MRELGPHRSRAQQFGRFRDSHVVLRRAWMGGREGKARDTIAPKQGVNDYGEGCDELETTRSVVEATVAQS